MPGTIRAKPTVSQPLSSANVSASASASAATAPVAKMADAVARPGRGRRLANSSVALAMECGEQEREGGERNRAIEFRSAQIKRDKDGNRRYDRRCAP
jgi:hypothetical protein